MAGEFELPFTVVRTLPLITWLRCAQRYAYYKNSVHKNYINGYIIWLLYSWKYDYIFGIYPSYVNYPPYMLIIRNENIASTLILLIHLFLNR